MLTENEKCYIFEGLATLRHCAGDPSLSEVQADKMIDKVVAQLIVTLSLNTSKNVGILHEMLYYWIKAVRQAYTTGVKAEERPIWTRELAHKVIDLYSPKV